MKIVLRTGASLVILGINTYNLKNLKAYTKISGSSVATIFCVKLPLLVILYSAADFYQPFPSNTLIPLFIPPLPT